METIKIKKPLLMQTKSAEIVGSINDLLTEIPLRLPIKSLIDFKLVSKQWHSIITNPTFCHLRSCRKTNPAGGLDSRNHRSIAYFPFSKLGSRKAPQILRGFSGITILQSCNGLLLCRELKQNPPGSDRKYLVCNPTTKQFSFIPKLEVRIWALPRMILAFDPTKSPHYHVVCVQQWWSSDAAWFKIQIYSSETGSWNICGAPFLARLRLELLVYWKGAIHWMDFRISEHMYFDIDSGVLHKMPMSHLIDTRHKLLQYFEESCDHLHLIAMDSFLLSFNVYEMKSDYSEWFVKYKVDLSLVVSCYPEIIRDLNNNLSWYYFHVLTLVRYEEEDDKEPFLVLRIPGKILRYNLVSLTFEELHELVGDNKGENVIKRKFFCWNRGFLYFESLSCV